jgi:hypothetical protein
VIGERIEQVGGLYPAVPFLVILNIAFPWSSRVRWVDQFPRIDLTVASRMPALLTPWFSLGK